MNGIFRAALVSSALAAGCAPRTTDTLTHAMAVLEPKSGASARGAAIFSAVGGQVTLQLYVTDATPGTHGVRLHETGDCSAADAMSAGGPWAELGEPGNLEVKEDGTGTLRFTTDKWSIDGSGMAASDVVGHAVVVHGEADTGPRIACGVIRRIDGAGMMMPPPPSGRTVTTQLWPRSSSSAFGTATFTEVVGGVELQLSMSNLTPGNHGAHLHEVGDCSDPAALSTAGHWSLDAGPHGMHAGDFPNLQVGADGTGTLTFLHPGWVVDAPLVEGRRALNDVVGHAIIVHAAEDDLVSQPAGNAGARVACGVIGLSVPAPALAVARMDARSGTTLTGTASFRAGAADVTLQLEVAGVSPGRHAVHVHERGDCSSFDALSAGAHWNPAGAMHGLPDGGVHHAGDIGNMFVGADGKGTLTFASPAWSIIGTDTVLGRALVVHQGIDDGLSQPAGDAGARAGCGLITLENQQPRAPRVSEYALDPKSGTSAAGRLKLTETGNAVTAVLEVFGATVGPHQVRLHQTPDCSAADALSAGDEVMRGPIAIGVVTAGANGQGRLVVMNPRWLLADGNTTTTGPAAADGGFEDKWPDGGFVRYDLVGRSVIVRAGDGPDAGARVSCGVIR